MHFLLRSPTVNLSQGRISIKISNPAYVPFYSETMSPSHPDAILVITDHAMINFNDGGEPSLFAWVLRAWHCCSAESIGQAQGSVARRSWARSSLATKHI